MSVSLINVFCVWFWRFPSQSFAIDVESSSGNDGRSTGGPGASFLGHATAGPSVTPGGGNDEEPAVQQASQFNVKDIIKSLEGTVPFIILAFAKIMYDHRLGMGCSTGFLGCGHFLFVKTI